MGEGGEEVLEFWSSGVLDTSYEIRDFKNLVENSVENLVGKAWGMGEKYEIRDTGYEIRDTRYEIREERTPFQKTFLLPREPIREPCRNVIWGNVD